MSTYPVTISSPIPPPPQLFSNLATLFTQSSPAVTGVSLFRNGVLQTQGYDYTLTGAQISFASGSQPVPGDILTADIFTLQTTIDGAAPNYGTNQVKQREAAPLVGSSAYSQPVTVVGTMDGTNLIFGLAFGATIFGTLDGVNNVFTTGGVNFQRARVYRNGILMTLNLDCSCSGDTIVFMPGQVPVPGDFILMMGWL